MIVGGNIDGVTRVMTTAIALETSKGDLPLALGLGTVLISVVVAVNAVASLAATDSVRAKKFVEALWNTPTPAGLERYYEGLLYMMSLLHCSGEFRIWDVTTGN